MVEDDNPGDEFTVTTVVLTMPASEYEIIAVPGAIPVTKPEVAEIVATEVLLLAQTPPVDGQDITVVEPTQMPVFPFMKFANVASTAFSTVRRLVVAPFSATYAITLMFFALYVVGML